MSNGGYSDNATACGTDQATVLQAVIAKLVLDLTSSGFTVDNCFVSDETDPTVPNHFNVFCMVSPQDGDFDGMLPVGGGQQGILEHQNVRVSVYTRVMGDQLEHSQEALLDASRGLLPLKKAVLKSLAGVQLYADPPTNSRQLLTEYSRPIHSKHPLSEAVTKDGFNTFTLIFQMPFFWDLS